MFKLIYLKYYKIDDMIKGGIKVMIRDKQKMLPDWVAFFV
jgi:hypothetical protein